MEEFLFDLPDLRGLDFAEHNRESAALWEAFANGSHGRVPVRFNTNPRVLLLNPTYNKRGITYRDYMGDPELMGQAVLEWQYWVRFLLPGDHEKGLPKEWSVHIDFENLYDAAWFGCPVHYRPGQVPDTTPILGDADKRMLFDRGIPDPFRGEWAERALRFLEHFNRKVAQGWRFLGVPVGRCGPAPFAGSDGIFTVAASLRGPAHLCSDLLEDPEYARELLEYVLQALIGRMTAWRKHLGLPVQQTEAGFADDTIELLSTGLYRAWVLPLHRRLFETFSAGEKRGMHLCGDAQRHFPILCKELGVTSFDTGYPVDFATLRRELGPEILIYGGPQVSFFLEDDPGPLVREMERILASGILEGGRFVLQEGNNLPPCAPLEVCRAFYEAGKRLGRVQHSSA